MKSPKIIVLFIVFAFIAGFMGTQYLPSSKLKDSSESTSETTLEHAQKHLDPTYVCPMHSQITSTDEDATCPICGMDLVPVKTETTTSETALQHAQKHTDPTYVCPMHSQITSTDEDATCPICGMDLVLVKNETRAITEHDEKGLPSVKISPRVINNLGVRTTKVIRGPLAREIVSLGTVSKLQASRNTDIKPNVYGRIEKQTDAKEGDVIAKGDFLFSVLSPERIKAQEEYLAAWDAKNNDILPKLWEDMHEFKFSDHDIKKLEETREIQRLYNVYAPHPGALLAKRGNIGDRVNPVSRVMTLGGFLKVSVNAEVFERQWSWIDFGQEATMTIPSIPGEVFKGKVTRVNPVINFKTRSLTASIDFATLNIWVKESMMADVRIYALPRDNVIQIPRDALIQTGTQARVVLAEGNGVFRPVEVEPGIESGDMVEIISGLKEDDEVVISAQFLIDSESSLSASLRRLGS